MSDNSQQVQGDSIVEGNEDTLTRAAGLLRALGQVISTKFEPGTEVQLGGMARKYVDWEDLSYVGITAAAELLRALDQVISTKFEPGSEVQLGGMARKYEDWNDLEIDFRREIASIESSFGTEHPDVQFSDRRVPRGCGYGFFGGSTGGL
ncbi:hypothetical protein GGX14DRAFT_394466 [Mycena pura]|uniref:Uncharacterized protein n=1 Tax=Mycena pura TaxID=153505 RepID=A0AAD6VER9_9AGAR|nr:hypothetical protein GGX14DRAFT_394466 [Mycena pura]